MANTFTALYYHIIFTTKNRERWLTPDIEPDVWSYLGGIARAHKMKLILAGGVEDHVHLIISIPPMLAVSNSVRVLKGNSSRWLSEKDRRFAGFQWQDGYGAFSVSYSSLDKAKAYVAGQREHHRTRTFQEEFRDFLGRHDIEFDERYVWG